MTGPACPMARMAPTRPTNASLRSSMGTAGLVIIALQSGCPQPRAISQRQPDPEPSTTSEPAFGIEVRELPTQDIWTLTYTFPNSACGLRYGRSPDLRRSARWRVDAKTETAWVRIGQNDELRFSRPLTSVVVTLPTDTAEPESAYQLNVAFDDGARLLYSGYALATPLTETSSGVCVSARPDQNPRPRWSFRTSPDRRIVLPDANAFGHWETPHLASHIYVYFGQARPISLPSATVVFDANMPPWLVSLTRTHLPPILKYFYTSLQPSGTGKPLILASVQRGRPGRRTKGGALDRVFQIAAQGDAWQEPSTSGKHHWLRTLAHESSHLASGSVGAGPSERERWVSEGSASYLEKRALLDLGWLPRQDYDQQMVRDANRCMLSLQNDAMWPELPDSELEWTCGAWAMRLLDAELRMRTRRRVNLLAALRQTLRHAEARHGRYTTEDFLSRVESLAGTSATSAVRNLLFHGLERPAPAMAEGLRQMRANVVLLPFSEKTPRRAALDAIARLLSRCMCGHRRALRDTGSGTLEVQTHTCGAFQKADAVDMLGDISLRDEASRALAYATAQWRVDRPVPVGIANSQSRVLVSCPRSLIGHRPHR